MQNYFALSIPQVRNDIDFSPFTNALNSFNESTSRNQAALINADQRKYEREVGANERAYQRSNDTFNRQRVITQDRITAQDRSGKIAFALSKLKDPLQRKAGLDYLLAQDPSLKELGPVMSNPDLALGAIASRYGYYDDPLETEAKKAKIAADNAQAAKYNAEAYEKNLGNQEVASMFGGPMPNLATGPSELPAVAGSTVVNTTTLPREGNAPQQPQPQDANSIYGRAADEIKMLPTASQQLAARRALAKNDVKQYDEIMAPVREKLDVTRSIRETLELAKKIPARYPGTFESAVGSWQGADPDGWAQYINPLVWAARAGGSIYNLNGKYTPGEVRDDIAGITRGIVDKIKKLQGLGAKSADSNFELQNLIVQAGNLAQANDVNEYYRRLKALNDRIDTLYNIKTGVEFPEMQFNDSAKDFPQKNQAKLNNYKSQRGLE